MPVVRRSRPVSSVSRSVSVSSTAYPYPTHCYYSATAAADDSTVYSGRTSHTYSHCSSHSTPGSGKLSRSHSARSLRSSGTSKSSKKHSHSYYDYYDYHDNTDVDDEEEEDENIETASHHKMKKALSSHTPVYSVDIRNVTRHHYNSRRCAYVSTTATTSTRTVRKQFKDCGHDQIAMAIRCAQRTQEVVRAFQKAVDMHGYTMSVSVPAEGKATVTVTEYRRVAKQAKKNKDKKKQMKKKRTSNGPLHDLLYANGKGSAAIMKQHNAAYYYQYDDDYDYYDEEEDDDEIEYETKAYKVKKSVPALVEDVVPGSHTYVCNTGWVRPATPGHRRSTAEKLILALPQFSFHWSDGEFMVGSVRAAIDRESRHITISAPTLMSRLGDVYGVEDIGMKGMRNFFYWNRGSDNSFCKGFEKPAYVKMYYDAAPKNIARW